MSAAHGGARVSDQCPVTLVLEHGRVLQCQLDGGHDGPHFRKFVSVWQGTECGVEARWEGDHR